MKPRLLIILSPPRSFSSVVSTMIGQHPELYCFPELHLFVADTVGEVLDREAAKGRNYAGPPGTLRALAELHDGVQTTTTVLRAGAWLLERREWSTRKLVDHMLDLVAPRMGIEKSPVTCMKPAYLQRTYRFYPDACYLHLTRHPLSTRKSMDEFFDKRKALASRKGRRRSFEMDNLLVWYRMHRNIIEFTRDLPPAQVLRLKGEDVLSEPDLYLPQIAAWLGVSTDPEAIEEMKHPERSPYARVGPAPTRGGNDGKFMRSPALRSGRVREPSLRDLLAREPVRWISGQGDRMLAESGLRLIPEQEIAEEVRGLARCMGYH